MYNQGGMNDGWQRPSRFNKNPSPPPISNFTSQTYGSSSTSFKTPSSSFRSPSTYFVPPYGSNNFPTSSQSQLPFYQARGNAEDFHSERFKAFGNDSLAQKVQEHKYLMNRGDPLFNRRPQAPFASRKYPEKKEFRISNLQLSFDDIFTLDPKSEDGTKMYTCKLCKLSHLSEINLKTHMDGNRHKHHVKLMTEAMNGIKSKSKEERHDQFKALVNNKVYCHTTQYNKIISEVQPPLIGMTYCIEILDTNLREPCYVCSLCDKKCDPRTMVFHFISQTHRMNYIEKHFTSLSKVLHGKPNFDDDIDYRQAVLVKVSAEIENRVGRGQAFIYEGSEFDSTKEVLYENIKKRNHINEQHIENSEVILVANIDFNNLEVCRIKLNDLMRKKKKASPETIKNYQQKLLQVTEELNGKLRDFKSDPGAHPFYNREWQIFWNRKCEERGGQVKEADVINEWYDFFLIRMQELHDEEVKNKTEDLRKEMGVTAADLEGIKVNEPQRQQGPSGMMPKKRQFNDRHSNFKEDFNPVAKKMSYMPNYFPSVKLIPTLRILSTLEMELGLLAPKILDLLSRALAADRDVQNSSDRLLFVPENLNLIEMAKEKLIGLQMANLIPNFKLQAVDKALNEVGKLIDQQDRFERQKRGNFQDHSRGRGMMRNNFNRNNKFN